MLSEQWAVGPAGQKDWSALSWYGSEGHYKNSSIAPGWSLDCKEAERNDLYKQKACFKCGAASVSGLDNYIGCVKNDPIAVITESQSFYIRFGRTLQSDGQEVVQCPT